MLASFVAISSLGLALAEQEATRPLVLLDELGGRPTIVRLARGGNDRKDPFAELKKKRAAEQAKAQAGEQTEAQAGEQAGEQTEEKPKPAQVPAASPPAGES